MQRLSPYTALATLLLFKEKKLAIDEETFDQCVDTLVSVLEDTNDEKYRLTQRKLIVTPEG